MSEMEMRRAAVKQRLDGTAAQDMEMYRELERRGVKKKYFPRRREGGAWARWDKYIGKAFRIVARVSPAAGNPMWVIEFDDGFRMAANRWEVLI